MPGPTITLDPSPPTQGKKLRIRLTGATLPQTLDVDFDPPGEPPTVTIGDDGNDYVDITVPSTAADIIVSGGGATPVSSTVTPA